MTKRRKVNLLETTLRDGSYAINFTFTSVDTAVLCRELEAAGFTFIEIGHGVGLNSSNMGKGKAVQTDEEYMIAADENLKKAKYGMFCIPGIARLEDVDLAAKHNMEFIRIGTNVTEVESSKDFIKRCKDYGMFVTSNFMKSYALDEEKFAQKVKLSEKYGTDIVYLVDSAGGMFSEQIIKYHEEIRKVSDISLGFHGHDNLGLAVANSLLAADQGFDFIDCSLQGIGRSSGNAATEILVAALLKRGYEVKVDFLKVLEIGAKYIQQLMTTKGKPVLDIVSGYADFHSSYMHFIQKYSAKYNINPILLIIELTKIDKVNANETILEQIAKKIKKEEEFYLGMYNFNKYVGGEQDDLR